MTDNINSSALLVMDVQEVTVNRLEKKDEYTHLFLAGIATSGVILSTVREAADKNYQITIISDLCVDFEPEIHKVLMEKIFPRQALVITVEDCFRQLQA